MITPATSAGRLIVLCKYASPPDAMAGTRWHYLLKILTERGYSCELITADSSKFGGKWSSLGKHQTNYRVGAIRFSSFSRGDSVGRMLSWLVFDLQALIYGVFRPQRPTAVVASSPSMLSLVVGLCLAKFYRCALVLEVRDIWPLTAIEEYGYRRGSLVVKIAAFVERFTMSSADAVVGFGENFCQHYSSVTGRREGCFSIGQGVSAPSIPPFTPVRRAGRMRVGYFGSLGASNFLDPLIDAARQLERNDEIEFVVYGQGEKASQYQEASSGLTNIRFYGAISKAEAREKMQECHVLFASMIPSQLSLLGQSLTKIVDYLSAGRAIVFAYDGPRKMLEESGAVWIVDPQNPLEIADTLSKIATVSESELNSIGKSGYDWCLRSCDYRAIADSYEEVLSSVAEARSMKKGA